MRDQTKSNSENCVLKGIFVIHKNEIMLTVLLFKFYYLLKKCCNVHLHFSMTILSYRTNFWNYWKTHTLTFSSFWKTGRTYARETFCLNQEVRHKIDSATWIQISNTEDILKLDIHTWINAQICWKIIWRDKLTLHLNFILLYIFEK